MRLLLIASSLSLLIFSPLTVLGMEEAAKTREKDISSKITAALKALKEAIPPKSIRDRLRMPHLPDHAKTPHSFDMSSVFDKFDVEPGNPESTNQVVHHAKKAFLHVRKHSYLLPYLFYIFSAPTVTRFFIVRPFSIIIYGSLFLAIFSYVHELKLHPIFSTAKHYGAIVPMVAFIYEALTIVALSVSLPGSPYLGWTSILMYASCFFDIGSSLFSAAKIGHEDIESSVVHGLTGRKSIVGFLLFLESLYAFIISLASDKMLMILAYSAVGFVLGEVVNGQQICNFIYGKIKRE